jgi:phosphatidylserine decarboxylase
MRIAPESRPFVLLTLVLLPPVWWWGGGIAAALPLAAFLFVLFFFRDPSRPRPDGEGLVLSPADGRVVDLTTVEDSRFPGGHARRLSIFLSLFDVHVNRAPVAGTVQRVEYSRGRFRAAFRGKASEENERNRIDLDTQLGPVAVTQIAGAVARRIVCDVAAGDRLAAGERFGMIRFGSRVDLFLPVSARPRVARGDRVRAVATVLAELPPVEEGRQEVGHEAAHASGG